MPEGTILARGSSKNGKPTITIDQGDDKASLYYAGNTDLAGLQAGDRIQFTCTSFANGKLWGIDKGWKLLSAASKYPPLSTAIPSQTQVSTPTVPQGTGMIAAPAASYGIQDAERPCVSNWGAELIKAGLIKDPADLGIWVTAIKNVLR
jgi:hypothetical protein